MVPAQPTFRLSCRYADASALRDQLKQLQQKADAAAAITAEQQGSRERQFRLGQRVVHAHLGYRGIMCGCDHFHPAMNPLRQSYLQQLHLQLFAPCMTKSCDMPYPTPPARRMCYSLFTFYQQQDIDACRWDVRCCEDEEWQAENGVDGLKHGSKQPFYHILVDLRDWEDGNPQTAIAYVPEEVLMPAAVSCPTADCMSIACYIHNTIDLCVGEECPLNMLHLQPSKPAMH